MMRTGSIHRLELGHLPFRPGLLWFLALLLLENGLVRIFPSRRVL